jgi:ArsR family transcriptional regulator
MRRTLYIDSRRYDATVVKKSATVVQEDSISQPCCAPLAGHAIDERDALEMSTLFAALADPVRLRLLSLVASQGEVCSCNLETPLAKSQSTISHHTSLLANAGLIAGEKRGRWTYWRIVPEKVRLLAAFLDL